MSENTTPWHRARHVLPTTFLSTLALIEQGLTPHGIRRAVTQGRLVRLRRGRYVTPDTHPRLVDAGLIGGRLDCVSLLAAMGVFVREHGDRLHVQFDMGASRLPPRSAVTAHWRRSGAARDHLAADLIEALAQACRCQGPREAIATLDSAWHHGLVDESQIAEVFARLPRRYRRLRGLLDPRAESGPETLMRLMLRALGCHVEVQVDIHGVGRVDFVVDGWLIVECDSRQFHSDWIAQKRDRRRDLAAAALGYTTVRPIAEDILGTPDTVLASLKAALAHPASRRGSRNSFDSGHRRAQTR
ncbi:endonuclease domain-containing protein [Microbacterium invictum]|uniref:Very-short-patch-repair endonuclease n=1 Tax=Microbacterium invictum TaxID=515415 RepID=A0AA40VMZ4_9MICO|nr:MULTISPECIES: hypothetical protein [Microbacterium]MBB4139818.1 very-short-patch-repair endonuclease [Microbacterium invictum]